MNICIPYLVLFRTIETSLTCPWIWVQCRRRCMKGIMKTRWSLPKTFASFSATLKRTHLTRNHRWSSTPAIKKSTVAIAEKSLTKSRSFTMTSFVLPPDLHHDPQLVGLLWKKHHLHHLRLQVCHSEWTAGSSETQLQGPIAQWRQLPAYQSIPQVPSLIHKPHSANDLFFHSSMHRVSAAPGNISHVLH